MAKDPLTEDLLGELNASSGESLDQQLLQEMQSLSPNEAVNKLATPPPRYYRSPQPSTRDLQNRMRYDDAQQDALSRLKEMGWDDQQRDMSVGIAKMMGTGRKPTGRIIGAIAGELAAAAAINLIPGMAGVPEELITVPHAIYKGLKIALPVLGAGLGGVGGEAVQISREEGRRASLKELLNAFLIESGTELGMHGLVRTGKAALAPFIKKPIGNASELVKQYQRAGANLSASQLDERLHLTLIDEITHGAFGSKELAQQFLHKSAKATDVVSDGLLDAMVDETTRLSKDALAQRLSGIVGKNPRGELTVLLDDVFKPAYKELHESQEAYWKRRFATVKESIPKSTRLKPHLPDEPIHRDVRRVVGRDLVAKLSPDMRELENFMPRGVSTKELKRFALQQLKKERDVVRPGLKAHPLFEGAMAKEFADIMKWEDAIPWSRMFEMRSRLLRKTMKFAREMDPDEALYKQLESLTFDSLTDPKLVKGMRPEDVNMFNNLRGLWKTSREGLAETFNQKLLERAVQNPSRLLRGIIPEGNPRAIRQLRQSLMEPISGIKSPAGESLWKQVRTAWFANILDDVIDPDAGTVRAGTYYRKMR
ncbi:MAG: hypothetical protein ACYSUX_18685, partial [Planctomycetota bacterium]